MCLGCRDLRFGPPYWTLPTLTLGDAAAAAGIGLINAFGALGGFVGPAIVGRILTAGFSFSAAVVFLAASFLAAGLLTFALRGHVSAGRQEGKAQVAPAVAN